MAFTKLMAYNSALRILGEGALASLTEAREPRRLLDAVWDEGAIDYCLQKGQWQFATRTVEQDYTSSIEPAFGFTRAFQKPDDYLRTTSIASDEYFKNILSDTFADEAGYWYSDLDTLYIKYISNDNLYGNNMALWPQTFFKYLTAYLAYEIAPAIANSKVKQDDIKKKMDAALKDAESKDAINRPTNFLPRGNWASARRGNFSSRNVG